MSPNSHNMGGGGGCYRRALKRALIDSCWLDNEERDGKIWKSRQKTTEKHSGLLSVSGFKCFVALNAIINVPETDWVSVMVELAENNVYEGRKILNILEMFS